MPATSETLTYHTQLVQTLQHRSPGYVDAITKQSALMWWLRKKGRYKPTTGHRIEEAVMYKVNTQEPSISGFDLINLQEQDFMTLMLINWKHYLLPIVINGQNLDVYNTGPEKMIDVMESTEDNALGGMYQSLNEDLFGDGTGNSSKVVTGLAAICDTTPTVGTLYGINRATTGNEFHQNQLVDQGSGGAAQAAYAYGANGIPTHRMLQGMTKLWQLCGRLKSGNGDNRHPDFAICSEAYERTYDDAVRVSGGQRIVNKTAADAGFTSYAFKGMTILADQDCPNDTVNSGSGCLANFLNSKYLNLRYSKNRNFKVTDLDRLTNQDGYVAHLLWSGELCCTLPAKQGVHIGIVAL